MSRPKGSLNKKTLLQLAKLEKNQSKSSKPKEQGTGLKSLQLTIPVEVVVAAVERPTPLKTLPFEEKMKAILTKDSSDLFKDIIYRQKNRGRPKAVASNALINSIRNSILK
jgi:hypothetical protein